MRGLKQQSEHDDDGEDSGSSVDLWIDERIETNLWAATRWRFLLDIASPPWQ